MEINTIRQGDCLEVMQEIESGIIDMILCDLPYGTTACKWDVVIPFEPLWKEYKRIIKDNGAIVLTASQPFTSALVMSNPKMFKYEWIWIKTQGTGMMTARKRPMKFHENILVFFEQQCTYNPQMWKRPEKNKRNNNRNVTYKAWDGAGQPHICGDGQKDYNYPRSYQEFNRQCGLHPTQKPVALFEYLIKTYTNENELVLDNCAGSGTTGEACLRTNRNYILIEKEQKYVDIARERIQQFKNSQTNSLFNL